MNAYNPDVAPDSAAWLALDEQDRIDLILAQHAAAGVELPSLRAHAAIHCAVETQIAEGFTAAVAAMRRLREDGLSRHDALHAIGSVLAEHLYTIVRAAEEAPAEASNARYGAALDRLTARQWRKRHGTG